MLLKTKKKNQYEILAPETASFVSVWRLKTPDRSYQENIVLRISVFPVSLLLSCPLPTLQASNLQMQPSK